MRELIDANLVEPLNPYTVLGDPRNSIKHFINFIDGERGDHNMRVKVFKKFGGVKLNTGKFADEVFQKLTEMELAARVNSEWYRVEAFTANQLMTYLASLMAGKLHYRPITDTLNTHVYGVKHLQETFKKLEMQENKRRIILEKIIPGPADYNIGRIKKFKTDNKELLDAFRTKIELLVLDPNMVEGSALFNLNLSELEIQRKELSNRMFKSSWPRIGFGSACGITGGIIYAALAKDPNGFLAAGLSLLGQVYDAISYESPKEIIDQSGMKYIALANKRLR